MISGWLSCLLPVIRCVSTFLVLCMYLLTYNFVNVGYILMLRIEYTDKASDFVVENLPLSGRNLFPNIVSLEARNFIQFSPHSPIINEQHHELTFTFGQIQADMRGVAFILGRRRGFG
jgi:hypothetical protein